MRLLLIGLGVLLSTDILIAMQQQEQVQTQEQEQTQTKIKKKKDPQDNQNNSDSNATDAVTDDSASAQPQADLQTEIAAIMATVAQNYGSIDGLIKAKTEDHQRICSYCGRLSITCWADLDRIRHGEVIPCGCEFCRRDRDNRL